MRKIAGIGLIAAIGTLAGCQLLPYDGDRFTATVYDEIPPRPVHFPTKIMYPDYTMFGFPIYDEDLRADLKLDSISCRRGDDGRLVVLANVHNMGAMDIYGVPFFNGDMAAFRVAATVTTASGAQERFEAIRYARLNVASNAVLTLNSVTPAAEVTRIDVVADPDRVVPDPIRDNNVLTWRGRIDGSNPQCDAQR